MLATWEISTSHVIPRTVVCICLYSWIRFHLSLLAFIYILRLAWTCLHTFCVRLDSFGLICTCLDSFGLACTRLGLPALVCSHLNLFELICARLDSLGLVCTCLHSSSFVCTRLNSSAFVWTRFPSALAWTWLGLTCLGMFFYLSILV